MSWFKKSLKKHYSYRIFDYTPPMDETLWGEKVERSWELKDGLEARVTELSDEGWDILELVQIKTKWFIFARMAS